MHVHTKPKQCNWTAVANHPDRHWSVKSQTEMIDFETNDRVHLPTDPAHALMNWCNLIFQSQKNPPLAD